MGRRRDGVRWGRVLVVMFALAIINVPYVLHEWQEHRAATDGVPVTATVVGVSADGDDAVVTFRFPQDVDEKQTVRTVKVHHDVGARAARSHQLEVRVLEGQPGSFHVDGQVRSSVPLIITLVADALIALLVVLSWRRRGAFRRPTLIGVALEDLRSGEGGSILDKQDDGSYLINGEVARAGPSSVVLALRDRDVEIHLRDHANPIPVGERARVRAQLVG
jgi:hypothetical protein